MSDKKNIITAKSAFEGYTLIGVCVTNKDYINFCLRETAPSKEVRQLENGVNYRVRFANCIIGEDKQENKWSYMEFEPRWQKPTFIHADANEYIIADEDTSVWFNGVGKNKQTEKNIDECFEDSLLGIFAMANVDGTIIGTGGERSIYIRKGANEWDMLTPPKEVHIEAQNADEKYDYGRNKWKMFTALDGFSLEDIYLAGGLRDVWHYNHKTGEWKILKFNTDKPFVIQTVCCADDGKVYVGGRNGMLAIGRDNEWEFVRLNHGRHIEKIVSFNGKIFIGTEAHTYVLKNEHQSDIYDFNGELNFTGGHMLYSAYGNMLVGNTNGKVALYNNGTWQALHGIDD